MKNPIWRPEPRLDVAPCFLQTSCFYPLVSSDLRHKFHGTMAKNKCYTVYFSLFLQYMLIVVLYNCNICLEVRVFILDKFVRTMFLLSGLVMNKIPRVW